MKKIKNNWKNFEFEKSEVVPVNKAVEPIEVKVEIRQCDFCGKIITRDWCEDDEVDENDFCSKQCFKKGSDWYGDWWDN